MFYKDKRTSSTIGKIVKVSRYRMANITYIYEVNNQAYEKIVSKAWTGKFKKDQLIKVFYDPNNPQNADFVAL